MKVYQNIENGNVLFTIAEVYKEACELYDYGDPTNDIPLCEYYQVQEIEKPIVPIL